HRPGRAAGRAALLPLIPARRRPAGDRPRPARSIDRVIETYPALVLLPPLVAIALVVITKKVLVSLGAGALAAALLIAELAPLETLRLLWGAFAGIFWVDGALNA